MKNKIILVSIIFVVVISTFLIFYLPKKKAAPVEEKVQTAAPVKETQEATPVKTTQETPQMSVLQEKLWKAGFGIPQEAMDAPNFSGTDLEGNAISLKDLKGKVILLNLWATWCPPCRAEMPSLEKLHQTFKGSNFTIIAVATPNPPKETREKIINLVKNNNYTFPVIIDESKTISYQYGSGSIPTSWIIDAKGKVIARLVGGMDWNSDSMIEIFKELIP